MMLKEKFMENISKIKLRLLNYNFMDFVKILNSWYCTRFFIIIITMAECILSHDCSM